MQLVSAVIKQTKNRTLVEYQVPGYISRYMIIIKFYVEQSEVYIIVCGQNGNC